MKTIKNISGIIPSEDSQNIFKRSTNSVLGFKRIIKIIILFFILGNIHSKNCVFATNGDSCIVAISNPLQEGYAVIQSTYKKWYSFYANDTIATLNFQTELSTLPDSIIIYYGNCDSLIQYRSYRIDTNHNEAEINSISFSDISGSQITCNFTKRNNQLLIETINLAKGFYIVKLVDRDNKTFNVSFVKE